MTFAILLGSLICALTAAVQAQPDDGCSMYALISHILHSTGCSIALPGVIAPKDCWSKKAPRNTLPTHSSYRSTVFGVVDALNRYCGTTYCACWLMPCRLPPLLYFLLCTSLQLRKQRDPGPCQNRRPRGRGRVYPSRQLVSPLAFRTLSQPGTAITGWVQ